jgi:hypothetical protein
MIIWKMVIKKYSLFYHNNGFCIFLTKSKILENAANLSFLKARITRYTKKEKELLTIKAIC